MEQITIMLMTTIARMKSRRWGVLLRNRIGKAGIPAMSLFHCQHQINADIKIGDTITDQRILRANRSSVSSNSSHWFSAGFTRSTQATSNI